MSDRLKLTPLIKGLITGVVMVATSLLLDYTGLSSNSWAGYLFYILYAAGITWTLLGYYRSPAYKPGFGSIFGQGFRCFIVVTLITVVFTWISASMQPQEKIDKAAMEYKEDLLKKKGDRNATEIEEIVNRAKKHFVTQHVSGAIFGTLITGAIFTAAGAGLLLMRRN